MNRYPLLIIAAALALLAAVAWRPAQQYAGLQSPVPSPAASPSPAPSPQEPIAVEQEPEAVEPTAAPEAPRFDKCVDGSPLTVISADANQVNYKCASGAVGAYLR